MSRMKRREFISLLSGVAAWRRGRSRRARSRASAGAPACSCACRSDDVEFQPCVGAFLQRRTNAATARSSRWVRRHRELIILSARHKLPAVYRPCFVFLPSPESHSNIHANYLILSHYPLE
jgi:hypothetical protein